MGVQGQIHASAVLLPVPTGPHAGWVPVPVWTQWRREKSLPLSFRRKSNSDRLACSVVTIPTELPRVLPELMLKV